MKTNLLLAALSAGNTTLLFGQLWFVWTFVGPGAETDALYAANVVPQILLAVLSGSIGYVLVPLLATDEGRHAERDGWGLFLVVVVFFSILALGLGVTTSLWIPAVVPGFTHTAQQLAGDLTKIQLVAMVCTAAFSVLWSIHYAKNQFARAELVPILANLLALAFVILALPRMGIYAAAWGAALAAALQVILLLPALGSPALPDWRSPVFAKAGKRIKPLLMGAFYFKSELLLDRILTSLTPVGSLSLFYLGQQLYSAANQIMNKGIAAPMVPRLSVLVSNEDIVSFRAAYRQRLIWAGVIAIPVYLVIVLFGESILKMIIGHGMVNLAQVHELWWIMTLMGGVLIGGALGQVLSNAFYARGDTRTPTLIGALGFTIGIGLKLGGFFLGGIAGLALGTSAYYLINAIWLHRRLEKVTR